MTVQELIAAIRELTTTTQVGKGLPRPMGVVRSARKKKRDEEAERIGKRYAAEMNRLGHEIAQQSGDPCLCDRCLGLDEATKKGERLRSFFDQPKQDGKPKKEKPVGKLQGGEAEVHRKGKTYYLVTMRWGYPSVLKAGSKSAVYGYAKKQNIKVTKLVERSGPEPWIHGVGGSKQGMHRDVKAATRGKQAASRTALDWPKQWTRGERKKNIAYNK